MSQHKGHDDGSNFDGTIIVVTLAVVVFAVIMWLVFGPAFSIFMSHLRRFEMMLFAPFYAGAAALLQILSVHKGQPFDLMDTGAMLTQTGNYVRWLYLPAIIAMAVWLYMKSYRGKFNRKHTMKSLALQESKLWPEIAPVAGKQIELVTGDITKGEWAVPMTEWEFAKKHGLAKMGGKLDREAARAVFIKQLGPIWNGSTALPVHTRAILAAFILRIAGKKDESTEAFRKMSLTFAMGGGLKGMDTKWVDAVFAEHESNESVQKVYARHAYVFTVLATMQQIARADGVLASPMYIWLKTVDRRLFFTLNGTGRFAFFVESGGIMAHWLFEKTVKQGCHSPMVEKAIDGLELGLSEYTEDDSGERLYL